MNLSGIPAPRMDWGATNMVEEFEKFQEHCELIFRGPLKDQAEDVHVIMLLLYMSAKGREIYHAVEMSEEDRKKPERIFSKVRAHIAPTLNPPYQLIFMEYTGKTLFQLQRPDSSFCTGCVCQIVMECTLDNGRVFSESGCSKCLYACDDGYRSSGSGSGYSDLVYCDRKSRRWLLSESGIPPCNIKGFTPPTPQDAAGLSLDRIPTVIPNNFQSSNIQLATYRPDNTRNTAANNVVSDAVIAGTVGSILGLALVLAVVRACIGFRNRQERHRGACMADAFIQRVLEERRIEEIRSEVEENANENASETENITETQDHENDLEGFLILQIRRCFTMPFNPFAAFQNHPEPPPYDVESVSPPAYEES